MNNTYYEQAPLQQGVRIEDTEDNSRWEIDTAPILDAFYHELLGETQNGEGIWVRDQTLKRWMNEKGASWIKSELTSRIDKITLLSKLGDEFIRDSLKNLGKTLSDMLFNFYEEWDINPTPANLVSLSNMILEKVEITYQSAMHGGIREYRVRSRGGISGAQQAQGYYNQFTQPQHFNDNNGGIIN